MIDRLVADHYFGGNLPTSDIAFKQYYCRLLVCLFLTGLLNKSVSCPIIIILQIIDCSLPYSRLLKFSRMTRKSLARFNFALRDHLAAIRAVLQFGLLIDVLARMGIVFLIEQQTVDRISAVTIASYPLSRCGW